MSGEYALSSSELTKVLSDIEIAQRATLTPIEEVASKLGLTPEDLECHGRYKAKIQFEAIARARTRPRGKLILVTAMTPTPAGEGKTTLSIGLAQALSHLGKRACVAIREPSLGPVFGVKGGAAGGGYSQVVPMEDINLHFTGDIHAITTAHNLLVAMIDNQIHQGNLLAIDPRTITIKRCLDVCDRALRHCVVGLGGPIHGVPRETGFEITAASEVMAVHMLAKDIPDLKKRLGAMLVAYTYGGHPVTASQIGAVGAMAAVLRDALKPNLVQTLEGTPAFVHSGPFGNVAAGCSSVTATILGLHLSDYLVTEAGFGSDLGAEKFIHIKCRSLGIQPDAVVVAATIRALKMHGGLALQDLDQPSAERVAAGMENLLHHVSIMRSFGLPV
ncbi:MAG: formate--tetrahydrofolate ligase, partial [Armatimonadetes bacterium]|nr:formate--tetrahydrofolate ligase [Armatimonadota bacterium]